ncbi:PAS domain S-box protein [Candidatus Wolfebacteria bacterium]|nr:PAS domain S-box protein [Candidatus Wolfebacteria bacterium]
MIQAKIAGKKEIAKDTIEITLDFGENIFDFEAGQYLRVIIPGLIYPDLKGNSRVFSITSSPSDKHSAAIAFRMSQSGFKRGISELPIGVKVEVEGPFGSFILPKSDDKKIIFISGGIGITPFLSMARFAAEENLPHKISLLHSDEAPEKTPYVKELKDLEQQNKNFYFKTIIGKLDIDFIKKNVGDFSNCLWYISGLPQMILDIKNALVFAGIDEKDVIFEEAAEVIFSSKEQLMAIIESNPEGIVITDLQGVIKYVNYAWQKLTGWSAEEVVNKGTPRLIKSGKFDRNFYVNLWNDLLSGKTFRGEITNRKKDGSLYDTDEILMPLKNYNGGIIGFAGFQRDISERKRAEERFADYTKILEGQKIAMMNLLEDSHELENQLKAERDQAQSIISSMEEGLLVVDANQKIILMNLMAEKLLEIPLSRAVGQDIGRVVVAIKKGKEMQNGQMPIIKTLNEKKPQIVGLMDDMSFQVLSGKKFPVALTAAPFKMESGVGAVVVFRDITKEQEVDKAKSEFISLASHQLRTPPTIINWHIEMLLKGTIGNVNDKQREYLKEINTANLRMIDLVNSLLNISRIELGTFVFEQHPVDIVEIAKDWVRGLSQQIKDKKINIVENYDADTPLVPADENIIGIIFQNLITNAIKYAPENGRISVDILRHPPDVIIKVSDNGCGIPKSEQKKIFTKFFRASNAKEADPEGNGLGLYIVKSMVEQIGGKIWFESEEGKGAIFFVSIPSVATRQKV